MVNWATKQIERLIHTTGQRIDAIDEWFAYWAAVEEANPLDETPAPSDAFKVAVGFLIGISMVAWQRFLIAIENTAIRLRRVLLRTKGGQS